MDSMKTIKDQVIFREGDTQIDHVYFILEGEFAMLKKFNIHDETHMRIVEKTGLIIDISPNKHSSYKQKLVKDQQLRIMTRN